METIIGLLVVLLPVIFKLIGNRLEKSELLTEILPPVEETPLVQEEPIIPRQSEPAPIEEAVQAVGRKPILQEEEPQKKGEKIDPKKLVIYSEIMKPKF